MLLHRTRPHIVTLEPIHLLDDCLSRAREVCNEHTFGPLSPPKICPLARFSFAFFVRSLAISTAGGRLNP